MLGILGFEHVELRLFLVYNCVGYAFSLLWIVAILCVVFLSLIGLRAAVWLGARCASTHRLARIPNPTITSALTPL